MRAPVPTLTVRRLACAAALALVAACSTGITPVCSDAGDAEPCGTFTPLPDATLDVAAPDGGEDASDAEEEGDDSSPGPVVDASDASPEDGSSDGSTDGHVADAGHD
jgi:hypothetical protein